MAVIASDDDVILGDFERRELCACALELKIARNQSGVGVLFFPRQTAPGVGRAAKLQFPYFSFVSCFLSSG